MIVPLHQVFSVQSSMAAQQLLSIDGEQQYDWFFLRQKVASLANAYSTHPAQRWILHSAHPLEFLIRFFALLHAGKQLVIPQNFQHGTLETLADAVQANAADLTLELNPAEQSHPDAPLLSPLDPELCHIHIFTSGSSGSPKCISKNLAEFEREIALLQRLWAESVAGCHTISTVPHHHIYGLLFRLLWPLATGRSFDCRSESLPELMALASKQPLVLVSSPAQLSRLPDLMTMSSLPTSLRQIFSSGGPLSAEIAQRYISALGSPPIEVYGSTETGGIAWRRQSVDDDHWTPFPGMQISLGQDNALLLSSPILRNPTPMRLEDAITLLPDQRFQLQGRLDRIVKLEEKRLSLPEVERVLHTHPWVLEAAAIVIQRQRPSLAVAVVLDPATQSEWQAQDKLGLVQILRQHMATWFDPVLLPRYWRFPLALPRSESGKLSAENLTKLFKEEAVHATAS